jgi:nucleotide-binding universal stress UspA family protein
METDVRKGPLVVGYDGREESQRALDAAIAEASERDAEVVVVVVANLPSQGLDPFNAGAIDPAMYAPISPDGPFEIRPIMDAARERLSEADVDGEVEWAFGDPTREILRVADERSASAIVVGTHHHSALGRLFGTDVASDLVRAAGREVIVVH